MSRITIHIEVPDDHPWTKRGSALAVGNDTAEVVVTNDGHGHFTVAHWQYDESREA